MRNQIGFMQSRNSVDRCCAFEGGDVTVGVGLGV